MCRREKSLYWTGLYILPWIRPSPKNEQMNGNNLLSRRHGRQAL